VPKSGTDASATGGDDEVESRALISAAVGPLAGAGESSMRGRFGIAPLLGAGCCAAEGCLLRFLGEGGVWGGGAA